MIVVKTKPTSPGRRFITKIHNKALYTGRPCRQLTVKKLKNSGRNNHGRITVRHHGGGHRQHYRIIDFRRTKYDIPGKIVRIEYDPNRTAYIALVLYKDGDRKYIIAPQDLKVGMQILSGDHAPIQPANCMLIRNIPVGTFIHNIELKPGKGGQMIRSAGSSAQLISKDNMYAIVRLRSGEVRKVLLSCRAVIGIVSNAKHNLKSLGKAGASRWRGIRPTVRGVAMNPIDHPHGGGEGRTSGGRHPVTPWGVKTKGKKTRSKKSSNRLIVQRRK